ncbi:hypothetical protein KUCAC02_024782, partial [Chaenocephalus aceratus]
FASRDFLSVAPLLPVLTVCLHPPGLKVRVTERGLEVDKEKLVLTLEKGSLLIDIKGPFLPCTSSTRSHVDFYFFKSQVHSAETDVTGDGADGGLDLKMKLQLKRTKGGRLEVAMLECEAGKLTMETNAALPKVNSMLEELPMKLPMVVEELKLAMDYSVSEDITVTPSGLDLPLRGLVYLEGQENVPVNTEGADLDLGTDRKEMLYLGISDFFLNSYAASLYEGEAMTRTWEKARTRLTNYIKAQLEGALKDGVKIPLPPKITFVQGPVTYHEGFMVLAGSLDWTEDAMKTLVETILDGVCFHKFKKTEATLA